MRFVVLQLFATSRAKVLIGTAVDVTQANDPFKAPAARQHPVVTVCYTNARHPALEAVAFQFTKVGAEKFEVEIEVAEVVHTSQQMGAYKVPVEAFAQPVAKFRLDEPVLPLLVVVAEGSAIEVGRKVECPLG